MFGEQGESRDRTRGSPTRLKSGDKTYHERVDGTGRGEGSRGLSS